MKTPVEIVPGAYFTGNIERVTAYEKVPQALLIKRGEKLEHDTFPGEQALFFKVKGKGLVVLSGCAHAGIVNTVKQAQKSAGTDKVHAIMGGFHLINAKPEIIQSTVADIKAMKPDLIVPAHCTGFEAIVAFSQEMPGEFVLNTAGTQYSFYGVSLEGHWVQPDHHKMRFADKLGVLPNPGSGTIAVALAGLMVTHH